MENENRKEGMELRLERQKQMDDLFAHVFNTEEGKTVLADLMIMTNMYNSCFGKDNNETNKMLGARTVGLYIMDRINHKFTKTLESQMNYKENSNGKKK